MSIAVQDIGRSEYGEAWDYQDELFKKIVDIKLANRNRDIEMERPGFQKRAVGIDNRLR